MRAIRTTALFLILGIVAVAPAVADPDGTATSADPVSSPSTDTPSACASLQDDLLSVSIGGITAQATCQANCGDLIIQCDGDTCSAADRNCSVGQQGFVECDGDRTYCPDSCCPCGACGTTRLSDTGQCCSNNLRLQEIQECTTSGWQDTGDTTCIQECGGTKW